MEIAALVRMVFPKKGKKQQPVLKVRRRAGQSIRDEKERLFENRLMPYVVVPLLFWLVVMIESAHAWLESPPLPRFWLCVAVVATGFSWIGYRRLLPEFRDLNRGERGELRVAEILDDLRSSGYRAFHDLTGDGYNIDHVVVGPAGVFAIETKFRGGYGEIEFRNGEGLFVGGYPEEKDCLKQARGNAFEVNRIIKENCSLDEWVWPIVVFVGDWQVRNDWQTTDARVFTTDKLLNHIVSQQPRLKRSEIKLIASHLDRSVKS